MASGSEIVQKRYLWRVAVFFLLGLSLLQGLVRPFPPAGPVGASRTQAPPSVTASAESIARYVGNQADGHAWLFYVSAWSGGISETDAPMPSGSIYSDFRGVAFGARWPFVTLYDGHIVDDPDFGTRVQYGLDSWSLSLRLASTLSDSEMTTVVDRALAYLDASGVGGDYDMASLRRAASVQNDSDGVLLVKVALPPESAGARPGELEVAFTPGLRPDYAFADTVAEPY